MTAVGLHAGLASGPAVCAHCALPVPKGMVDDSGSEQFCCEGCRTVFGIVRSNGLERYYELRRELENKRVRAEPSARAFEEFDSEVFADLYTTSHEDGTVSGTLLLEGVHCAACVWLIEKLPRVVPGVVGAPLDFRRSTVSVRFDPSRVKLSAVARGLDSLGYRPHPPRGEVRDRVRSAEARRQLVRLGVAGALAGNTMLLAIALYAGMLDGISPSMERMLRGYSALLGLVALVWPGRVFFVGAIGALRARSPHLDIPIALALFVGGLWGTVNTVRGTGEIYFDSLTALVFLLLVGRFLQHRQQRRAADAVELLFTLTPTTARVIENGVGVVRPIEGVQIGDVCEVIAGETIPVDGELVLGETTIDNALLTGESTPRRVVLGERVHAGAVNLSSTVRVVVNATGEQTRVGQLMQLVSNAWTNKPKLVQQADRLAGWFVIGVASLATLTAVVWLFLDPSQAIEHATALLIVTCPCALGLATPLVFTASLGRLAKRGVLVKGGSTLERLARAHCVCVDKTGTLTTGSMRVVDWTGDDELRHAVASLEHHSNHPIALALRNGLVGHGANPGGFLPSSEVSRVHHVPGMGISGVVGRRHLTVGSRALMDDRGIRVPEEHAAWGARLGEQGHTAVLIADDGVVVAGAAVSGDLRAEAPEFVRRLERLGTPVVMLTGDRADTAVAVGSKLGLGEDRVISTASPEEKIGFVREPSGVFATTKNRDEGGVVMVGDGVNDAGALASASVGIAVAGGAEASLQAADIYLRESSLLAIPETIEAARATLTRVRVCLGVSLAYNGVAASLAAMGLIHPVLAAVLMPVSSLSVLAIASMRPGWDRAPRETGPAHSGVAGDTGDVGGARCR